MDMIGKKKTLIVLLIACMMAGQIYATYAADYRPHLQVTTTNTTFTAGSRGTMGITLTNDGNFDATEVEAIMTSTTPGVTPLVGAQKVINLVATGSSVSYNVDVFIDPSVATGAYVLTLTINYLRGGVGVVTVTIPISIIVNKATLPALTITPSSSKINAGAVNTVHLTIVNVAPTNVTSVDITLTSTSPLVSIVENIDYHLDALNAGSSAGYDVVVAALENTPIGAYVLTAQVWYVNSFGITVKQAISIPLEVTSPVITKSPVVTVQNMNPATVLPGESFTITLKVTCAGAPIYNARAVLGQDATGFISPLSQTTVSLGDMAADASNTISYNLLIGGSAVAADIPLLVTIKYVDNKGVPGTATETITIPVENLVDFALMKSVVVSAAKGATTTFEGDLLLIGTGKADFAIISVVPGGPVQSVAGSTEYIGAIDPDSPVPFTIQFNTGSNATLGDYNLTLKITYLNSRNIQENRTITMPLQVVNPISTTPTTSNDGGFWGWVRRLFGLQ